MTDHKAVGRTPRRRGFLRWLAAAAAAALTVGGLPTAAAETGDDGVTTTLTIAESQPVDSLSPFLAQRVVSTSIHRLMYDYLTNYAPETNAAVPGLAESWQTSADELTWTYTLRDDATWSDGEPVTAQDVVWTLTTMMTDEAAATANGNFVTNFEKVTAVDKRTVEIQLSQPQATMLALDIPILPEHIWSDVEDFATFNNDTDFPIVGNGPFILTDYQPNQSITLEANPDYWRGAPKFDRLVFRYFNDQDAMVEALRTGAVSFVAGLTPAQADALRGEGDITVNAANGKRFQAFTINPGATTVDGEEFGDGHPALADRVVRRAIVRAIDKEALVDRVFGGYAEAADGYIPSRYSDYHFEPEADERLGFDPRAANAMLDEAGYTRGDDGIRVSPEGERLSFRLHVHNNQPENVQAARFMTEWLADIGIEIRGRYVDPGVVSDALHAGEYDLIFTGWLVNPDPDYVLGIHTCDALPTEPGAMRSDAYFCDEEYDRLYAQQLAEYDPATRAELIQRMQRILYQEAVVNVLTYPDMLEAYRSDHIAAIQVQPEPGGNIAHQDGYWSWWSAAPAEGLTSESGPSTVLIVGITICSLLVVTGTALVVRHRRATAEDRE
ncbi:ABC transporter substrate-binding protein [Salinactinospora qingdaonensis]|uniref:ABC transporter substrate-binding protein n=1 Tax=Salinactinospora qingdaonensis TaxID=702744 RepID=A0ABP7FBH0_9ACTN